MCQNFYSLLNIFLSILLYKSKLNDPHEPGMQQIAVEK